MQHDFIKATPQSNELLHDATALDSLLNREKPFDQWNAASLSNILESLVSNPETRSNFRRYLQSGPDITEEKLVKELLMKGLKQSATTYLPELNPLHEFAGGQQIRPNVSLVSLLGAQNDEDAISVEV